MGLYVDVASLCGMKLIDGGFELMVAASDGDQTVLSFKDKDIMHLIEYACLASYSLTKSREGQVAALQLVDAMTHQFADGQIGIEIAFGEQGGTFLACPEPVARKLIDEIQKRLPDGTSAKAN